MSRSDILYLLRVYQWPKNIFLFVPLFFTHNLFNFGQLAKVSAGFFLFCLVASAGYILNDVVDREKDKLHPFKKNRPIAAGKIKIQTSLFISLAIISLTLPLAFFLDIKFGGALSLYLFFSLAYSFFLKKIKFLDLIAVSSFFILRVFSGALILNVPASKYLLLITFLLALFIVSGKRLHEKNLLGDLDDKKIIKTIIISLFISIIGAYIFYGRYLHATQKINSYVWIFISLFFIILGLARFIYLSFSETICRQRSFDRIIFDGYIIICIILWGASLGIPLYGIV